MPTFWTLNDCNEAGLKRNPVAEALFLDSVLTARAFENTCGMSIFFGLVPFSFFSFFLFILFIFCLFSVYFLFIFCLFSVFLAPCEKPTDDDICTAPAIVFANAGGPPGKGYAGLSQVTAPFIGPLTRMGSCAEGMSVVDLDMQILEDAEANYKVREDMAREEWHYDYRHTKDKVGGELEEVVEEGKGEEERMMGQGEEVQKAEKVEGEIGEEEVQVFRDRLREKL